MIITPKLVLLNFPKTGSTFARAVLKEIHNINTPLKDYLLSRVGLKVNGMREIIGVSNQSVYQVLQEIRGQHSTYSQIPRKYKSLPVVSIIRNPFERYVSLYEFRWWVNYPLYAENPEILQSYPSFPDITFKQYMEMTSRFGMPDFVPEDIELKADVGLYTLQFLRFFHPSPDRVIRNLTKEYLESQSYRDELGKVTFLHTENLTSELMDYLKEVGYSPDDYQQVAEVGRKNVNRGNWQHPDGIAQYYDEELIRRVRYIDRLLFDLFPEYSERI